MDPYSDRLGVEVVRSDPDEARARLQIKEHHMTGFGVAHGAAIYGLAHVTFAALCRSQDVESILALNTSMSFLHAAREGETLSAVARPIQQGRRFTLCRVTVSNEKGQLAEFQGRAYVPEE